MSADLADLIIRLEAAQKASRALDAEIANAVGWREASRPAADGYGIDTGWFPPIGMPHSMHWKRGPNAWGFILPYFTTSVDVALTLMPSGCRLGILVDHGDYCAAKIAAASQGFVGSGSAPSLALAVCIASLRAKLIIE